MVQFKIFVNIDDFSCVTLWAQNVLIPSTYMLLWKLCLNLWNRMWLDPSLSLILSFKPLGLWKWKVLFSGDLMESYIRFWKSTKLPEFPLFQSKSFHSITVTGRQNVLNISILNITMRNGFVMSCHIHLPTIIDEIFWEFIMFPRNFDLPQVKRKLIRSIIIFLYELPQELPNNLRLSETRKKK